MNAHGLRRISLVVAVCALVGALAGIAGSAAAPTSSKSKAAQSKKALRKAMRHDFRGGFRGPDGGPVHSEAVVPNQAGTGFDTITMDAGLLNSVDGTTVHLKEGTSTTTYKDDVAIDVGDKAMVIRNHEKATLADLKQGDHVRVIQGPKGNVVMAEDDAFLAQEQKDHQGFDHHGFGPPGGGMGGPPPGAPAPGSYPGSGAPSTAPSGSGSNS